MVQDDWGELYKFVIHVIGSALFFLLMVPFTPFVAPFFVVAGVATVFLLAIYSFFVFLFVNCKLLCVPAFTRAFFQAGMSERNDKDHFDSTEFLNYVLNSSITSELVFESLPQVVSLCPAKNILANKPNM